MTTVRLLAERLSLRHGTVSGWGRARQIRQTDKTVPIVLLTSMNDVKVRFPPPAHPRTVLPASLRPMKSQSR